MRARHKAKVKADTDLTAKDLQAIIEDYKKLVKKETKKAVSAGRARATGDVARRGV